MHCSPWPTLLKIMQNELFQKKKRRCEYFTKQARQKKSNHAVVNKQEKKLDTCFVAVFPLNFI